jgi:hypothetical protein
MEHRSIPPSPQKITRQLIGVFPSFALLAALQLQLFTALGKQMLTCEELAVVMGVQGRRLFPVLNVLVLGELLQQTGDRYCNSEESAYYLVKGSPNYIGGAHELYADMYQAALQTAESIRTNRPAAEHDFRAMGPDSLFSFFRGLHGMGVVQGRALARDYHFEEFDNLADVGGGSGNIAIGVCEVCPNLHATVLEVDKVVPVAEQFIALSGLGERIKVQQCDITRQAPHGKFDIAVLRNLIQVLSPQQAARTIQNVGSSMRAEGRIFIIGHVLDDARRVPWEAAAWDIAFLNIYEEGQSYTEGEYRGWLRISGFGSFERTLMGNNMSLITARKL